MAEETQASDPVQHGVTTCSFVIAPEMEWKVSSKFHASRRQRILDERPFEEIVHFLGSCAKLSRHKRERARNSAGFFRINASLLVGQEGTDLFHSGRGGYRAQYYANSDLGTLANTFALNILGERLIGLLGKEGKWTCRGEWVKSSLDHPQAKVWIHQGSWYRLAPKHSRNLCVERWQKHLKSVQKRSRHCAVRASLIPDEVEIDLKGGFVQLDGTPLPGSFKPSRASDIYQFGYT